MPLQKNTYQDRANNIVELISIAEKIVNESSSLAESTKNALLNHIVYTKNSAINPEPQFKKIASLKHLESNFLIYWNEAANAEVELFWKEVANSNLDFKRKDVLKEILNKKKIKNIHEYNTVIDSLVIAEQTKRITKDEALDLSNYINVFEARQKK